MESFKIGLCMARIGWLAKPCENYVTNVSRFRRLRTAESARRYDLGPLALRTIVGCSFSILSEATPTKIRSRWNQMADLANELQRIYDCEINLRIDWVWDGGIEIRLGDRINGFIAEESVRATAEILPWLQEAIARFYPGSEYATSLAPDVGERAAGRLFLPPSISPRLMCPHCGAPNAAPEMDEVFAFVCRHCGESVEVPRPKVH